MARKSIERNISYDNTRGVYYVCLDGGRNEFGERCRGYRTAPSLRDARKLLRDFDSKRSQGRMVKTSTKTVRQWLDYWLTEIITPTRAETTTYGYRKIVENHLIPALGHIPLQRLSPQDIQQYYNMLLTRKSLSTNTVRRHHDLLSACLRTAVKQDALSQSPVERVEPPRYKAVDTSFYNAGELRQLYEQAEGTPMEMTVKLAGGLGLRREELCGLKWQHVDFEHRTVHIRNARTSAGAVIVEKETKNRSSTRTLHLTPELLLLLRQERWRQDAYARSLGPRWPETDFVLVNRRGNPPSPNALSLAFSRFVTEHGLPKLTLHGLRHTFATVASEQGAPLFEIGKALGHSTPATTGKIYTHLVDHTHTATMDRVAAATRSFDTISCASISPCN